MKSKATLYTLSSSVRLALGLLVACSFSSLAHSAGNWKPNRSPSTEVQKVYAFTAKPSVKSLGDDKYEISFAVKGYCDVAVSILDNKGKTIRHLGAGVLGANAPAPFQKNALKQTLIWNGKDDFTVYHRDPNKLRVKVMLGMKPEFERRLGGTSPNNLPGLIWGLTIDESGVYVFSMGTDRARLYLRKFDRDGKYLKTLSPPPANLPEAKLQGMGFVEYEKGKKAVHARDLNSTVAGVQNFITNRTSQALNCQPVVYGGKVYFCDRGIHQNPLPTYMHSINADGSMDSLGSAGRQMSWSVVTHKPRMAVSPDGEWIYMAVGSGRQSKTPMVFRIKRKGNSVGEGFLGNFVKPANGTGKGRVTMGSDNKSFQMASGIACDPKGRIYVADRNNNRLQVFAPDGKYVKTIKIDRPNLVQIHQKTGAIYVIHLGAVKGKSVNRLTKLASFENPKEVFHVDHFSATNFAVDSWSKKTRIWVGGSYPGIMSKNGIVSDGTAIMGGDPRYNKRFGSWKSILVFEEDGKKLKNIMDFDEIARKADSGRYLGRWQGGMYNQTVCDVSRNQVYVSITKGFGRAAVLDLDTGKYVRHVDIGFVDDIAFDKHGRLHAHLNPGNSMNGGVVRLDPSQFLEESKKGEWSLGGPTKFRSVKYREMVYDYGTLPKVPTGGWKGIIRTKDQGGAKWFQDGVGVTMRGEVAAVSYIYHVPKMDDVGKGAAMSGVRSSNVMPGDPIYLFRYRDFIKKIKEQEKQGESVYFIRRQPGISLAGGTIWTYDSTGELRSECAVIAGDLINGVQMDENGNIYFVNGRSMILPDGSTFLGGKGGIFGEAKPRKGHFPFTGTLFKTRGKKTKLLLSRASVSLPELPERRPDVFAGDPGAGNFAPKSSRAWMEGAYWLYGGASPIVLSGCSCPTMRFHLDWQKRTYMPEAYRHSFAVLDTNGNLIMHLGKYGNLDSGSGPKSKIPVGGDGISVTTPRFIGGTDDRLVFDDYGERLVVLKINYHAEETVNIKREKK